MNQDMLICSLKRPLFSVIAMILFAADFDDSAQLLLDQAYVLEGEPVADPAGFASRLTKLLSRSLD